MQPDPRYLPVFGRAVPTPDEWDGNDREIVGTDDLPADAARSGADVDLRGAHRESDNVPVGRADAEADARCSGDPGER